MFGKKYNLNAQEMNEEFCNMVIREKFWNLTEAATEMKLILDEVVKGSNKEWNVTELRFEKIINASETQAGKFKGTYSSNQF